MVLVIGAGPAGLTAADRLSAAGHAVRVLEASPHVGGLARSFELWGQIVDVGPHRFFSSARPVNEFWRGLAGTDYTLVDRLTRIYYGGKFFMYPLQPLDALSKLGPIDVTRCLASYAMARLERGPARTFEEWVVQRFGRRLFEIFFKSYSEKIWGIPCSRIDADWAAQRIKKLSLFEAVRAAFLGDPRHRHKTLLDQFAYPNAGAGSIYTRLAERIALQGGSVSLNTPVARVLTRDGRITGVVTKDGTVHESDVVVSTMPLTLMVKSLADVPAPVQEACDALYFRNAVLVYVEVEHAALFPDNWIYVHSDEVRHGRITNFRNWSPGLWRGRRTSILCMEYWCFEGDSLWRESDETLGALAEDELRRIGLVSSRIRCLGTHVLRVPRVYPVYETGYAEPLRRVQGFVDSIHGLYAIGRYGAFKYNNQDHSILMGLLLAREITTGTPQGLWGVNTDSEYLEDAELSETGLEPG
jgi:protoporphyrinogen oxidase